MARPASTRPIIPKPPKDSSKESLPKKVAAHVASMILTKLGLPHDVSWKNGYSTGHTDGKTIGTETGYRAGKSEGYKDGHVAGVLKGYDEGFPAGYNEGHATGLEKGKTILEISDRRTPGKSIPGVDDYLFDSWEVDAKTSEVDRFKSDVERLLPPHKQPTTDQWLMILSKTPSTYVVAGAGSGKSTTLVLRILFLHHYLGYELDSMTVVTFTNMSRFDFIRKLCEVFLIWGITLRERDAKPIVQTFHSKILSYIRGLPGMEGAAAFEFYKGSNPEKMASSQEQDNSEDLSNDPAFGARLGHEQIDLLHACYRDLYVKNARFRSLIQILYEHSLTLQTIDQNDNQVKRTAAMIREIAGRDKECADVVEQAWEEAGKWPIKGIVSKRETIKVLNQDFHIHGRIAESNVAVVLGAKPYPGADFSRPNNKLKLVQELISKERLLKAYCTEKVVWLDDPKATEDYIDWLAKKSTFAPGFNYRVDGEISAPLLVEAFFTAAGFIENLGLDVPHTIGSMTFLPGSADQYFFEALGIFWPAFEKSLMEHSPPIMTFNRMFSLFGENSPANLRSVPLSTLRSMSHLMIDEFQDISPQIVSWVRAVLREVRRRGEDIYMGRMAHRSSLMCVGDDWQSIYGWRGSAPKYFIEFEKEFRAKKTTRVMLQQNYRSHQYIIDAAEHIVRNTPGIDGKQAVAAGPAKNGPIPVEVRNRDDEGLSTLAREHYERGETVMVLYRRSADKDELLNSSFSTLYREDQRLPEKDRRIKLLTYHKSKGLEAHAVFLIGDCVYMKSSPFKNQAYLCAKLGVKGDPSPYDTSQKQELLRLAYVAITRSERHCYWYINPPQANAAAKPKASAHIPKNKPFFVDARTSARPLM